MSQSDFASLAVQYARAEEVLESGKTEVHGFPECKQQRADLQHSKSEDSPSIGDVSNDVITDALDALYDFVAAWEADCMNIDENAASVSQSIFEPVRRVKDFAPPKRFFRTFWRSTSRRVLAFSRAQTGALKPESDH